MSSTSALGLFWANLKSRRANRENLARLESWFLRAGTPDEILSDFKLDGWKTAVLLALSAKMDGWHPFQGIIPEMGLPTEKNPLAAMAGAGLIGVRPFKKQARLSDSGRYILILCAETTEKDFCRNA
jgi:hypothetical protein